jgi:hypothetical protein
MDTGAFTYTIAAYFTLGKQNAVNFCCRATTNFYLLTVKISKTQKVSVFGPYYKGILFIQTTGYINVSYTILKVLSFNMCRSYL